eukprot:snap_masked-scaffold_9-processed-gene-12.40-mRNA-1 protein AED:1.00 eAED:1.00 QI:0/0/0/0/1/1/2/0/542
METTPEGDFVYRSPLTSHIRLSEEHKQPKYLSKDTSYIEKYLNEEEKPKTYLTPSEDIFLQTTDLMKTIKNTLLRNTGKYGKKKIDSTPPQENRNPFSSTYNPFQEIEEFFVNLDKKERLESPDFSSYSEDILLKCKKSCEYLSNEKVPTPKYYLHTFRFLVFVLDDFLKTRNVKNIPKEKAKIYIQIGIGNLIVETFSLFTGQAKKNITMQKVQKLCSETMLLLCYESENRINMRKKKLHKPLLEILHFQRNNVTLIRSVLPALNNLVYVSGKNMTDEDKQFLKEAFKLEDIQNVLNLLNDNLDSIEVVLEVVHLLRNFSKKITKLPYFTEILESFATAMSFHYSKSPEVYINKNNLYTEMFKSIIIYCKHFARLNPKYDKRSFFFMKNPNKGFETNNLTQFYSVITMIIRTDNGLSYEAMSKLYTLIGELIDYLPHKNLFKERKLAGAIVRSLSFSVGFNLHELSNLNPEQKKHVGKKFSWMFYVLNELTADDIEVIKQVKQAGLEDVIEEFDKPDVDCLIDDYTRDIVSQLKRDLNRTS